MSHLIKIDSTTLSEKGNVNVGLNVPGISNCQVSKGGHGWPTPYNIGLYIDTDNNQMCIIDWPEPCTPIKFTCRYGSFVVFLDTATEDDILSAIEVKASFFRDD